MFPPDLVQLGLVRSSSNPAERDLVPLAISDLQVVEVTPVIVTELRKDDIV